MARLTKLEILNETIEFYSEDVSKRSTALGFGCVYNGDNGTHCAIARCFIPFYKDQGKKLHNNTECNIEDFLSADEVPSIDMLLEDRYHGHELQFWVELQRLHDFDKHWNDKGLSELGEIKVEDMKEQFGITE
jgi:hypothetical protein